MTNIVMQCYEKRSNLFTSDLQGSDVVSSKTLGCAVMRMGTYGNSANDYGKKTYTVHESKKSVNDMMILVCPDDEQNADSCYIHGFSTTHTAAEIVNIINARAGNAPYAFFYDFNCTLPTTGDLLF